MDSETGWVDVIKKKRPKHKYISYTTALRYQRDLDITGLAAVLISTESRNLQADGWVFSRVIRGDVDNPEPVPSDTLDVSYTWLLVANKWSDKALFVRPTPVPDPQTPPTDRIYIL